MKSQKKIISNKVVIVNVLEESLAEKLDNIDGKFCWGLPNYSIETSLKLKRLDLEKSKLNSLTIKISSKISDKDFIPIFSISSSEYLVYKDVKSTKNIYVFDPEHKKLLFYNSLEQFLKFNVVESKKSYLKEIKEDYDNTQILYKENKIKSCYKFIDKYYSFLNEFNSCNNEQQILISNALNLIGLIYKSEEKFEDSNCAFHKAFQHKNEYAGLNLVYSTIKNLNDYKKAKSLLAEIREKAVLSYTHFYLDYYEGLNELYNGITENAFKVFKKIPKTWRNDKEYLDKFKQNIGELSTEFPKLKSLKF